MKYFIPAFLLLLLFPGKVLATRVAVTGTITDAQGTGVNGTFVVQLAVPATDTTTNTQIVPTPVTYNLVNGAVTGTGTINDTTNMQPQGNYYKGFVYDTRGYPIASYFFTVPPGSPLNMGQLIPTTVTTSNILYVSPANSVSQTFGTLNNVCVVDGATHTTVASCVTALAANGGDVYIPAGSYSMPLASLVVSKPIKFTCEDVKATVINLTGTVGVGFLFNYDSNAPTGSFLDWSSGGIENCQIIGPGTINGGAGNAGTAVNIGDATHSPIGLRLSNNVIAGFAKGVGWGAAGTWGGAWGGKFSHNAFLNNIQDFVFDVTTGTGMSDFESDHDIFVEFTNALVSNSISLGGSVGGDFTFISPYISGAQWSQSNNRIKVISPTVEIQGNTTTIPVNFTGGALTINDITYLSDKSSGAFPATAISASAGTLNIYSWSANSQQVMSGFVALSGTVNATVLGNVALTNVSAIFTGSTSGYTFDTNTTTGRPEFNGNGLVDVNAVQTITNKAYRGVLVSSDQGSPCTNGELVLSAGWQSTGSATVTAVTGTGQTCSWTITTGTTTAANPTITDTLTNALPTATTVCEMNIHGGTHTAAAGEGFQQTTLSATAPIFMFNGTPTAGGTIYFVTRRCGP